MADQALRECDIVMKGGITSGIVYPRAAQHLANTYRFRRVGGTSAGAIAAVFVAAAECGRAHRGFDLVGEIPEQLGAELRFLFQPSKATKGMYAVVLACTKPNRTPFVKALAALLTILRRHVLVWITLVIAPLLAAYAVAAAMGHPVFGSPSWSEVLLVGGALWLAAFAVAVAIAILGTLRSWSKSLPENGYGICDGHTNSIKGHQPLTDWIAEQIDRLAGLDDQHGPLTFGDLWGASAVAEFDRLVPEGSRILDLAPIEQRHVRDLRVVDLEVMTTNLTLRRPYRFPFETRDFYFCTKCFTKYFPGDVLDHLIAHSSERADDSDIAMCCPEHPDTRIRYLPRPADIPLVVAARLSLSFPGLISAVPLCYVDYFRAPEHRKVIRVWFSDGGIASNFPMHLFDAMWPTRPTFGINLEPVDGEHGDKRTLVPDSGAPRSHDITTIPDFVLAILDTMQNWSDIVQLTMPIYRGRVAEVRLSKDQGGMNLQMPPSVIRTTAQLGADAAAEFDGFDLPAHQTKRFRTSMALVDNMLDGMATAQAAGFLAAVAAEHEPPNRIAAGDELVQLSHAWTDAGNPATAKGNALPHPNPDLRTVPRQ